MTTLKTYGLTLNGTIRTVVAAKTQKRASELMNITPSYLRKYGGETGNEAEVALCQAAPETVFQMINGQYRII